MPGWLFLLQTVLGTQVSSGASCDRHPQEFWRPRVGTLAMALAKANGDSCLSQLWWKHSNSPALPLPSCPSQSQSWSQGSLGASRNGVLPPPIPSPRHSDLQFSFFPMKTESPPRMGQNDCCNKSGSLHPSARSCLMSMRWCSGALSNQMQMKHIPRYHLISLEVYRELERGGDMG